MIEAWLIHLQLFPQQLWQFLRRLGRQMLAGIVAIVMPIGVLLGLAAQPERAKAAMIQPQPVTNLIHFTPVPVYESVPRAEETDRRGAMVEVRADRERNLSLIIPDTAKPDSVLLQPFLLVEPDLNQPYTTLLPVKPEQQHKIDHCLRNLYITTDQLQSVGMA
jgi:hypothetical protein